MKRFILALLIALAPSLALAQSSPGLTYKFVPTAEQWNSYFAAKQDVLGFTPLNTGGGTMTGPLITVAPTASTTGFRLTPGADPSAPVNGDVWMTSANIFARINGVTAALAAVGGIPVASSCGTSPVVAAGSTRYAGTVTLGTASPTGCVLTFAEEFLSTPRCTVSWRTNLAAMTWTVSTTALTLTQTGTSSTIVGWICSGV